MRNKTTRTMVHTGASVMMALAILLVMDFSEEARAAGGGLETNACFECHDDVGETFDATVHGRADLAGMGTARCEICHGSGQEHMDSGGEAAILNPATALAAAVSGQCLKCHGGETAAHWQGSAHDQADISCASCHKVHTPWTSESALKRQAVNETCLSCHKQMRKHLFQRSAHPLRNGQMTCVACHDPHGSDAEGAIDAIAPNEKCYECHAEKRGPFLFEHAPVRENCQVCHDPHGSNQTNLLKTAPPRLCQSCHLFGHHQTVPGQSGQVWNQNRSCVNCHARIHGSNHPSGVIFMR